MAFLSVSRDENGWTAFSPSNDSRICYVSATGNDGTAQYYSPSDAAVGSDPCDPDGPINEFATFSAALSNCRSGYPDWILFKRGDTFSETLSFNYSGRGATEPFVVGAYGASGDSPLFESGRNNGIMMTSGSTDKRWLAFFGLEFYANERDPNNADYVNGDDAIGFFFWADTATLEGILLEGCVFRFFHESKIQVNESTGTGDGIELRRCVVTDSYYDSAHAQGVYSSYCSIRFYQCVFDHNGWYSQDDSSPGTATIYNHNTYAQNLWDSTFEECMFLRASDMGNKFTSTGTGSSYNVTIENNLYYDGAVGIGAGNNGANWSYAAYRFLNWTIQDNVFLSVGVNHPLVSAIPTLAWFLDLVAFDDTEVTGNYIVHQENATRTNVFGMRIEGASRDLNIHDNVLYNIQNGNGLQTESDDGGNHPLSNMQFQNNDVQLPTDADYVIQCAYNPSGVWTFQNNRYYSDAAPGSRFSLQGAPENLSDWTTSTGDTSSWEEVSYPSAARGLAEYQSYIGETATVDAFITACRAQRRYSWDTRYVASEVNSYIKEGFEETLDRAGPWQMVI